MFVEQPWGHAMWQIIAQEQAQLAQQMQYNLTLLSVGEQQEYVILLKTATVQAKLAQQMHS
jgi:hypothetical protein